MTTFKAPSGVEVVINVAPWIDAKNLKKAVQREVSFDSKDVLINETWALSQIIKADSSDAVESALWPCLARCTYGGSKIVPETFNTIEARRDYYDIIAACMRENLSPLVEGLSLKLLELGILKKQASVSQESESTTKES